MLLMQRGCCCRSNAVRRMSQPSTCIFLINMHVEVNIDQICVFQRRRYQEAKTTVTVTVTSRLPRPVTAVPGITLLGPDSIYQISL